MIMSAIYYIKKIMIKYNYGKDANNIYYQYILKIAIAKMLLYIPDALSNLKLTAK